MFPRAWFRRSSRRSAAAAGADPNARRIIDLAVAAAAAVSPEGAASPSHGAGAEAVGDQANEIVQGSAIAGMIPVIVADVDLGTVKKSAKNNVRRVVIDPGIVPGIEIDDGAASLGLQGLLAIWIHVVILS